MLTGKNTSEELDPKRWLWGHDASTPRIIHTMLRIKSVQDSLAFYVEGLGMNVVDRIAIPGRDVTAIFVGYGDFRNGSTIELTHYSEAAGEAYTHGTGYGHVAIGMPDVLEAMKKLETLNVEVTLPPRRFFPGGPLVAFVKDPDGYSIELVQTRKD